LTLYQLTRLHRYEKHCGQGYPDLLRILAQKSKIMPPDFNL
jgi:hypothetical protein